MECPHCSYKHGYCWDKNNEYKEHEGEHGDFWKLPINMERQVARDYYCDGNKTAELMACPACKKTFIDEN